MAGYNFGNFRQRDDNGGKNILLAIALSMVFLTVFNMFTAPSKEELEKQKFNYTKQQEENIKKEEFFASKKEENKITKKQKKEVFLENDLYHVGFDINNNRISFLTLKNYKQHNDGLQNVVLLDDNHFIESGWLGVNNSLNWAIKEKNNDNITLQGKNDDVIYEIKYTINDDYSIIINQKVKNISKNDVNISSYSRASLKNTKDRIENAYAFRGVLMMKEDDITEISYDKIDKQNVKFKTEGDSWIGLSDQYWITALISNNKNVKNYTARYNKDTDTYQIDFIENEQILKSNQIVESTTIALIAPKKLELLQTFGEKNKVKKIDKVIDFGMFYFLSKPLLIILKRLYTISGNFGIAIILLTILVRMIIFPLANSSYRAMARMKNLSPKISEIREKYKEDKKALQSATYQLYKEENINPMSAVLPLLLQIPIFFALYKVLIISIEMRDAPFVGFILDLSSKDPSSIFNLFGLLPYNVPEALQIGLLPVIMGITMFLQQILSPMTGIDKTQQKIMKFLPLIFTIMFANMPAGLILYWSCSNIFTIIQQSVIMKLVNKG